MVYIDIERRSVDLKALAKADAKHRAARDLEHCQALLEYYNDVATARTINRLKELGMGLPENTHPLQVSLLRYAIERQSVTYSNPPARWLVGKQGKRLAESNPAHQIMVEAYEASQVDLAMREADGLRSLLRACLIRFYPVDELGRIECRLFTPDLVRRDPHPAVGHVLAWDRAFALALAGDVFEVWERDELGWISVWCDKSGAMLDDAEQPFVETGYRSPYAKLPALVVYDSFPGGRAWPSPRDHRIGAIESVNAIANDLWQIVRLEAHTIIAWLNVRAQDVPKNTGPGAQVALMGPTGTTPDVRVVSANPKLAEASAVLDQRVRQFLISEGLPHDDLEKGVPTLTGAALKTRLAGLIEKRKRQAPLAVVDERTAFEAYRAVHNFHASTWGVAPLPLDVRLDVEIAPLDLPVDQRELIEVLSRSAALGCASRIDIVMALRSCSRAQAIAILDQIDADAELYPFPVVPDATRAVEAGPKTSTAPDPVLDGEDGTENGAGSRESVIDAIQSSA